LPAEEDPPNAASTSALVTTEHSSDGLAPVPVPVPLEAAGLAVAGLETAAAGELAGALDGAEDAAPDDAPGVVAAPPLHAAKVAAARRIQIAALASVDARARAGRHRRDWRWERVTSMLDSPG